MRLTFSRGQPEGTGPQRGRWVVGQTAGARRILQSMGKESEHQDYTVEVKDRQIGLNPFRWAIYRTGWHRAVKRTASVYRTAEKCRIAGPQALRVYLSTGTVFAYKAPGDNADAVGITDDPNVIRALFLARDNGRSITGYTDDIGKIGWLDY